MTDPGQEKWIPEDVKNLVDPSLHPPEDKADAQRRSVPYLFAISDADHPSWRHGWETRFCDKMEIVMVSRSEISWHDTHAIRTRKIKYLESHISQNYPWQLDCFYLLDQ